MATAAAGSSGCDMPQPQPTAPGIRIQAWVLSSYLPRPQRVASYSAVLPTTGCGSARQLDNTRPQSAARWAAPSTATPETLGHSAGATRAVTAKATISCDRPQPLQTDTAEPRERIELGVQDRRSGRSQLVGSLPALGGQGRNQPEPLQAGDRP